MGLVQTSGGLKNNFRAKPMIVTQFKDNKFKDKTLRDYTVSDWNKAGIVLRINLISYQKL